ncbi:MAG TPA: hypothetical protein VIS96_18770 [Terrimicrobiaceae bacterium]
MSARTWGRRFSVIFRTPARVSCALLVLAVSVAARATENRVAPAELDIEVQAAGFGRASAADIAAVLQSAATEIWRHCPNAQLPAIGVYPRSDHPQTNFAREPNGRVAIGLTAKNTYWAQYSFQFAHEFCHTLANFANNPQRFVRYRRHPNFWLEESLCETASLFTLRAMSRSWRTAPPHPAWRAYAPWLNAYVERRLALQEHKSPAGKPFLAWFSESEPTLRLNPTIRDRNTIIAIQLLPLFEAEPRGWETLTFLNRGLANSNQSLARYLARWRSQCPEELRPFLTRLAAVFAVKL